MDADEEADGGRSSALASPSLSPPRIRIDADDRPDSGWDNTYTGGSSTPTPPAVAADPMASFDPWTETSSKENHRESNSLGSVASDSLLQSPGTAGLKAHREFLSPLRARRYEALRSSLSTPGTSTPPLGGRSLSRNFSAMSISRLGEAAAPMSDDGDNAGGDLGGTMKWSKLRKICDFLYSEKARKQFGRPLSFAVSGILAFGTSRGMILVFDYHQNCKHVLGANTKAVDAGAITVVAISADGTFVAGGHVDGTIFVWDLARSSTPTHHIVHRDPQLAAQQEPEGHVRGTPVLHLSFVGARHSVLVSGDARGMAFFHRFHRRAVFFAGQSFRLLGRYPLGNTERMRPSFLYSCAVLPLGNMPQSTDEMGIVALLTPYKLVIASTVPEARTHFALTRPAGYLAESTSMSAFCTWYPALRDKPNAAPLLAFAWCRRLEVLSMTAKGEHPHVQLRFASVLKHQFDESVLALHRYDERTLCILLQSWRVVMFDTRRLEAIASHDLLSRFMQPQDLADGLLRHYFEEREAEYTNQAFAGNFGSCFRVFKGKVFLLGGHEVAMGALLTWADRLEAMLQKEHHEEALVYLMELYDGTGDLRGTLLPQDDGDRRSLIQTRLLSTIAHVLQQQARLATSLVTLIFDTLRYLDRQDLIFQQVYEACNASQHARETFLEVLASAILSNDITTAPTPIVRELVDHFKERRLYVRLEDIITHLDPSCLDIDQVWTLCKDQGLYDALTFISTQAMHDWVSPLIEYISLIRAVLRVTAMDASTAANPRYVTRELERLGQNTVQAVKVFRYLSLSLTGKSYPIGDPLDDDVALRAKQQLYGFLFAEAATTWPPHAADQDIVATLEDGQAEPAFPYLRLLLRFDAATLFACLDDAFEESYLNGGGEQLTTARKKRSTSKLTRQYLINLLLGLTDRDALDDDDLLFLYMFVARNVPKYPQFILLSSSTLQQVVLGLCRGGAAAGTDGELHDDLELSVEYLLSIFRATDSRSIVKACEEAGFFRVLQRLHRDERDWRALLDAAIRDTRDRTALFRTLDDMLDSASPQLSTREREHFCAGVVDMAARIAALDAAQLSTIVQRRAPRLHGSLIEALDGDDRAVYEYLSSLMSGDGAALPDQIQQRTRYIGLMATFDPAKVLDHLKSLRLRDIDAPGLMKVLEEKQHVDAAVHLMGLMGDRQEAVDRTCAELRKLSATSDNEPCTTAQLDQMQRYISVGATLCQAEVASARLSAPTRSARAKDGKDLARSESMWLALLHELTSVHATLEAPARDVDAQARKLLRKVMQSAVTKLLVDAVDADRGVFDLVRVLRHFLRSSTSAAGGGVAVAQADSGRVTFLKDVLSTHRYHASLLRLADSVVQADLFVLYSAKLRRRNRGWRPTVTTASDAGIEAERLVCCKCLLPLSPQFTSDDSPHGVDGAHGVTALDDALTRRIHKRAASRVQQVEVGRRDRSAAMTSSVRHAHGLPATAEHCTTGHGPGAGILSPHGYNDGEHANGHRSAHSISSPTHTAPTTSAAKARGKGKSRATSSDESAWYSATFDRTTAYPDTGIDGGDDQDTSAQHETTIDHGAGVPLPAIDLDNLSRIDGAGILIHACGHAQHAAPCPERAASLAHPGAEDVSSEADDDVMKSGQEAHAAADADADADGAAAGTAMAQHGDMTIGDDVEQGDLAEIAAPAVNLSPQCPVCHPRHRH